MVSIYTIIVYDSMLLDRVQQTMEVKGMPINEIAESLVYDVPTAGKLLNLSRATAYSLAAQGKIPTCRFGKRVVVPKAALEQMLAKAGDRQGSQD